MFLSRDSYYRRNKSFGFFKACYNKVANTPLRQIAEHAEELRPFTFKLRKLWGAAIDNFNVRDAKPYEDELNKALKPVGLKVTTFVDYDPDEAPDESTNVRAIRIYVGDANIDLVAAVRQSLRTDSLSTSQPQSHLKPVSQP